MKIETLTEAQLKALQHDLQQALAKHGVDNELGVTAMLVFGAGLFALYSSDEALFVSTAELAIKRAVAKQGIPLFLPPWRA